MGGYRVRKSILICAILFTIYTTVLGTPQIALPINSQVPPVARVNQAFDFQFAVTTFTSQDSSTLTYALENEPSWLSLDSTTRTFSGTPTNQDMGSLQFVLSATDSTGSMKMPVTFVVVNSPAPQVSTGLGGRLATFGSRSAETSLEYYSNEAFDIVLTPEIFQGAGNSTYYATSANRSPLPGWAHFDSTSVAFSGVTPYPITSPDNYAISLFISTTPGFADASLTFTIVVSNHKFLFVPFEQSLIVTSKTVGTVLSLKTRLTLDGQPVEDKQVESSQAQIPSWMTYNTGTMSLFGRPPAGVMSQDVQVVAYDIYGDEASTLIRLNFQTLLFDEQLGILTATIGQSFTYQVNRSLFTEPDVLVSFELGAASSWLSFDESTLTLYGHVPQTLKPTYDLANITATLPSRNLSESQPFEIHIVSASASQSTMSASNPATTQSLNAAPQNASSHHNLSGGIIAGITIASIIAFLACLLMIFWLLKRCRRRRSNGGGSKAGGDDQEKQRGESRIGNLVNRSNKTTRGGVVNQQPPSRPPRLSGEIMGVGSSIRSSMYDYSALAAVEATKSPADCTSKTATDLPKPHRLKQDSEAAKSRKMAGRGSLDRSPSRHRSNKLSYSSQRILGLPIEHRFTGLGHGRPSHASQSRVFGSLMRSYVADNGHTARSDMSVQRRIDSFPFAFAGSKNVPVLEGADIARYWIRKVSNNIQEEEASIIAANSDSILVEERRQSNTSRKVSNDRSSRAYLSGSSFRVGSGYFRRRRQPHRSSTSLNLDSYYGKERFEFSSVLLQRISFVSRTQSGATLSSFQTSDGWVTTENSFAGTSVLKEESEDDGGDEADYDDDFDEQLLSLPSDRDRQEWHNRWSQRLIKHLGFEPNGMHNGNACNIGQSTRYSSPSSSYGPRPFSKVTMKQSLSPPTAGVKIKGHPESDIADYLERDMSEDRVFL